MGANKLLQQCAVREKERQNRLGRESSSISTPAIEHPLCRNTFCTILGIRKDSLSFHRTPKPSAVERAVAHGNAGRPPPQALTPEEVDEVVNFLLQQSRQFAIPNPRYTFSRTEDDPKLRTDDVENFFHFPAHLTKQSLYERFRKLCADDDTRTDRIISLTSFRRIIKTNDSLKHIRFDSHGTGACATCKALRYTLFNSRSDDRVIAAGHALEVHVRQALDLRQRMTEWMEKAESEWENHRNLFPLRLALACICLDFASGLKLPSLWEES